MNYQEHIIDRLETMNERSVLFQAIKKELTKRGHWKNKGRGVPILANLKKKERSFTDVSMQQGSKHQVSNNSDSFSDFGS